MKNRDLPARPVNPASNEQSIVICGGLTKREEAALHILTKCMPKIINEGWTNEAMMERIQKAAKFCVAGADALFDHLEQPEQP